MMEEGQHQEPSTPIKPPSPPTPPPSRHAPSLSLGVQEAWIEIFKNDASRDAKTLRRNFGTLQSFWERLEKAVSPADPPLSDTKALGAWLETSSVREDFMFHFGKFDRAEKSGLRSGMAGFGLGEINAAATAAAAAAAAAVVGKKKMDMSGKAVRHRKSAKRYREKKKQKKQ